MSGVNYHLGELYSRTNVLNNTANVLVSNVGNLYPRVETLEGAFASQEGRLVATEKLATNLLSQTQIITDDIRLVRDAANLTTSLLQNNADALDKTINFVENEGQLKLNAVQTNALLNGNVLKTDVDVWNVSKEDGKQRLLFERDGKTIIPTLATETLSLNGVNVYPYTRNASDLTTGTVDSNLMPNVLNVEYIKTDTMYVDHLRGGLGFNINLEETMYDSTAVIDGDFECDVLVTGGDFTFIQPITLLPGTRETPGLKFNHDAVHGIFVDGTRGMVLVSNEKEVVVRNIVQIQEFVNLISTVNSNKDLIGAEMRDLSNVVGENKTNIDANVDTLNTRFVNYSIVTDSNIRKLSERVTTINSDTDANIEALDDRVSLFIANTNANIRTLDTKLDQYNVKINSNIGLLNTKTEQYKFQTDANLQLLDTKVNTTRTMTNQNVDTLNSALIQYTLYANNRFRDGDILTENYKSNVDSNIGILNNKFSTFKLQTNSNISTLATRVEAIRGATNNNVTAVNTAFIQYVVQNNSKLNALDSTVETYKANIDSNIGTLNTKVDDNSVDARIAVQNVVSNLETVRVVLDSNIRLLDSSYKQFVSNTTGNIATLQTDATDLRNRVESVKVLTDANVADIKTNVVNLQDQVVDLNADVPALNVYSDATYLKKTTGGIVTGNVSVEHLFASSLSGTGLEISSLNANAISTGILQSNIVPAAVFNNFGEPHNTRNDFNSPYDFGFRYIRGGLNAPEALLTRQYYSLFTGLGGDFGADQFGMQMAIARDVDSPYLYTRFKENGSWKSWSKISAGTSDSVAPTSDRRLKYDETRIQGALDTIKKLDPALYKKVDNLGSSPSASDAVESGLIVQDVYKNAPELRHLLLIPEVEEPARLNYLQLIPYLISAIQEQQVQIDALKQRNLRFEI